MSEAETTAPPGTTTAGGNGSPAPPAAASPDTVKQLVRFGWAVAELRGRLYFGPNDPGATPETIPSDTDPVLPLANERGADDRLAEARSLVSWLADTLQVKGAAKAPDGADPSDPSVPKLDGLTRVLNLAQALASADPASRPAAWSAFAKELHDWDNEIQNTLTTRPYGEGSAYQLGRGLAECTWSLDPKAPPSDVTGWDFLLGAMRCWELTQILQRLSHAFPDQAAQTVMGSLSAWQTLASNDQWRSNPEAASYLRQQALLWRDLLVTSADPADLVHPASPLDHIASLLPAAKALAPQIAGLVVSVILLTAGAYFLTHSGTTGWSGAAAGVLGILGITASTATAKAKSTANSLLASVQIALQADLLTDAATRRPEPPDGVKDGPSPWKPGSWAAPISLTDVSASPTAPPLSHPTGPPVGAVGVVAERAASAGAPSRT
jgi:hypothetical protein